MTGPITVFAPARVDLSPGFTDVEPFCGQMPGRVVNVALDLGVEVTVHREAAPGPAVSFADRLAEAVARRLGIPRPVVRISAPALPAGSGLGSSGALSIALAYAMSRLAGAPADWTVTVGPGPASHRPAEIGPAEPGPAEARPAEIGPAEPGPAEPGPAEARPAEAGPAEIGPAEPGPAEARPAEAGPAEIVRLACLAEGDAGLIGGTQDQLASMYGGAGMVCRFRDLGSRVPIAADLAALGDRLVLVHGSGSRNSGSIIERVLHERPRARVLRTIGAMNEVGELLAKHLGAGDHDRLADLVNESTALLRELDESIVGPGVDRWLRGLGAAAAKPCGAGGPGAVWATLVDPERRPDFVAGVRAAGWSTLPAAPSAAGAG